MNGPVKPVLTLFLAALLAGPGCYEDPPNLNGIDLDELENDPTPQLINEAAIGLMIGHRAGKGNANGYVAQLGVLGRESYNFDPADPRFRTELLEGTLDGGSPAFGGNFWALPYRNIKTANVLIRALDNVVGMSEGEINVTRAYAQTIIALEFLHLINTRDENGAPIDVDRDLTDPLAPIVSKDEVFDEIERLLLLGCEGVGGCPSGDVTPGAVDEFPFPMSSGFAGFADPAGFVQFNRAVAARVYVYREKWDDAQNALDQSFFDPADADPDLAQGVYHVYGTGSGDTTNALNSANIYAHPATFTAALAGDTRRDKLVLFSELGEEGGGSATSGEKVYTSDYRFRAYRSATAPVPVIRYEELILLQAEIHIGKALAGEDAATNFEAARGFLNLVREKAGLGADSIAVLDATNAVDELLYDRRYSLLMEGGHRWIDMRRYGRLDDFLLDDQFEGLAINPSFPIPNDEINARQ